MSVSLPGAQGLFSSLQAALCTKQKAQLQLDKGFHDALTDFRWIQHNLTQCPTKLQELMPCTPTLVRWEPMAPQDMAHAVSGSQVPL